MKKDKDKALEQVMADIEKQFGKGAIMKLGERGVKNIVKLAVVFKGKEVKTTQGI